MWCNAGAFYRLFSEFFEGVVQDWRFSRLFSLSKITTRPNAFRGATLALLWLWGSAFRVMWCNAGAYHRFLSRQLRLEWCNAGGFYGVTLARQCGATLAIPIVDR
jgi:hypothetical protein